MTTKEQFRDVVLILDDDVDAMLGRPRKNHSSIRTMAQVLSYILRLRARLAGQPVLVHHVLLNVAHRRGLEGGAMGPVAYLVDLYGEGSVDEPAVLDLFREWVDCCRRG